MKHTFQLFSACQECLIKYQALNWRSMCVCVCVCVCVQVLYGIVLATGICVQGQTHAYEYTACIISLAVFTQITFIPVCHHSSCPCNQNAHSMVTHALLLPILTSVLLVCYPTLCNYGQRWYINSFHNQLGLFHRVSTQGVTRGEGGSGYVVEVG